MKILLIGGTKFLGRHLVVAAQARQHDVTIFHRGNHSSAGLEGVEEIYGDRNDDLSQLQRRNWDAVIDTCGYLPQTVRASAEALRNAARQYVFISSVSAYTDVKLADYDETTPLATLTPTQAARAVAIDPKTEITAAGLGELYGALKARCEHEAQQGFGSGTLIIRPGLLVGPLDPTDRFTYWVSRVARGGEVLAPGSPNRFVQFMDARDLAHWIVELIEREATGVFNAACPPFSLTFAQLLEAIKDVSQTDTSFTWADEAFLQQQGVKEWSEMPLYLAQSSQETGGFMAANIDKALAANLTFRTLADTIRDTLAWYSTQPGRLRAGIEEAREKEFLDTWHSTFG